MTSAAAGIRWPVRILAVLGALVLGLLTTAGPASAHNVLISSDPADGAVLDTAPSTVSFTFDQPIQNFDPVLRVIGPNGNNFADASPTIAGDVISAPMAAGPAGEYRAVYRIVSADGHPVTGQITFTLTAAAAGSASGTPTGASSPATSSMTGSMPAGQSMAGGDGSSGTTSSGGLSPWLWVGIGVAAVLVVAAIGLALRRPRGD
jgi:methionine-rich copper-binding protein CopC